jgi:thioredoxin reductase (NADPH)
MGVDIAFCQALELDVEIGDHESEPGRKQTVLVDLTIEAEPCAGPEGDTLQLRVNYHEVWRLLNEYIAGRRYERVEALAVDIARLVIGAHPMARARARVQMKARPPGMQHTGALGVECVRTAADFGPPDLPGSLFRDAPYAAPAPDKLDLIILGSGPAGLSAATVARALGLRALLLEAAPRPGGQLLANPLPAYDCPGFNGLTGIDIATRLVEDLKRAGGALRTRCRIARVDPARGTVFLPGETLQARFLLLATGAKRRTLGVPGESDALGRGPSPAARRHAHLYRGRSVLIVGGGDVALEEALLFAEHCERVLLIHRSRSLRARPEFRDAIATHERIEVRMDTTLEAIFGEPMVSGAQIRSPSGAELVEVAGVFICAGLAPNSELVRGQVETDDEGFVRIDGHQRTSAPRLYAAGDICAGAPWQIATAIGQAAHAVKDMQRRIYAGSAPL